MEKVENGFEHVQGIEHQSAQCCLSPLNLTKGQISQDRTYIQGIQLAWGLKDH